MLCVSVSNFSIYVYPNKTFIVAHALSGVSGSLWPFYSCAPCLTLITTKTIIGSFPHLPRCPFRSSNLRP